MPYNIITTFVHGYQNLHINLPEKNRPALWRICDNKNQIFSYPFPRNPEDFIALDSFIVGERPLKSAVSFKKLPRFGLTGLIKCGEYIYAGSWNGVYEINANSYELKRIISHRLMNDCHGICISDNMILTVLTCKDTVVFTDLSGSIIQHFTIQNDLTVVENKELTEVDWRFIGKQYRGSIGRWHFNYIQKIGNEIWLTSRNANAFVVIDLHTMKACMRLMSLPTPVLLHDGLEKHGKFYFTSIDGKILIAEDGIKTNKTQQEYVENLHLFDRDLVAKIIRLNETSLKREPNWCRGIDVYQDLIFVTIDGRYDSDLSFGVLVLKENGDIVSHYRLPWKTVGLESEIRFVTGFDICVLEDKNV